MEAQNNAGWKKLHHSGFPEIYTVIPDVQGTGGESFAHPQYETTVRAKGALYCTYVFPYLSGAEYGSF